jgi:hypothetical protein
MENIDGVFDDPAVSTRKTLGYTDRIKDDEAPQPGEYAFAATAEPSQSSSTPLRQMLTHANRVRP